MFGKVGLTLSVTMILAASCSGVTADIPASADSAFIWNEEITFDEQCEDFDDWDKPADPFRIYGNTYYVGTCGISAILIVGDEGHVLIDSGTQAGADIVLRNIRRVGVDPAEIKLLLHSHEHFDHVGGFAKIVKATGAAVVASVPASAVFASGLAHPEDPQYGMHDPLDPVPVGKIVREGDEVGLGNILLTPIATPGHTPGALSWIWTDCEDTRCRAIVYADSLSPVSSDSYRFSDNPAYVGRYREGLKRIAGLECDVLVTPHPSASDMITKLRADDLESGMNCADYATAIQVRLDERLAKEAAAR
jgi:metallo-beta-lactamase class B